MAFPRKLLADHEKMIFELRPHWISVLPSVLWTIAFLIALWLGYWAVEEAFAKESQRETGKSIVGGIATLAWIAFAIVPFLRWYFTMFVLTSDRLITRNGIIAKHSKEIPLERINDVAFSQTVIERVLGAGDLLIESAGERGQTRIDNVRKPEQVQLMIYKETEGNNERMMAPRAAGAPASPAAESPLAKLEALARLREQGAISEADYEAKKQDLLKQV